MRTYVFPELKSTLPDGIWQREPDKAVWIDAPTQLTCMIVRNLMGALCGYVGVAKAHPYWEKPDQEIDSLVEVHGGLNFSRHCREGAKECDRAICHTPEPGQTDNVWWFGFDCAHCFDLCPGLQYRASAFGDAIYRDFDYVISECESLAKQLAAISAKKI